MARNHKSQLKSQFGEILKLLERALKGEGDFDPQQVKALAGAVNTAAQTRMRLNDVEASRYIVDKRKEEARTVKLKNDALAAKNGLEFGTLVDRGAALKIVNDVIGVLDEEYGEKLRRNIGAYGVEDALKEADAAFNGRVEIIVGESVLGNGNP